MIILNTILKKYNGFYDFDKLSPEDFENIHLRRFIEKLLEEKENWLAIELYQILNNFDNNKSIKYLGLYLNNNSKTIINNIISKFKKEIDELSKLEIIT